MRGGIVLLIDGRGQITQSRDGLAGPLNQLLIPSCVELLEVANISMSIERALERADSILQVLQRRIETVLLPLRHLRDPNSFLHRITKSLDPSGAINSYRGAVCRKIHNRVVERARHKIKDADGVFLAATELFEPRNVLAWRARTLKKRTSVADNLLLSVFDHRLPMARDEVLLNVPKRSVANPQQNPSKPRLQQALRTGGVRALETLVGAIGFDQRAPGCIVIEVRQRDALAAPRDDVSNECG
jgi:hypothetical protein